MLRNIKNLEHIKLAIIFIALNVLDMFLTQIILLKGGWEANPIMKYPLGYSMALSWSIKLTAIISVTIVLLYCATFHPRPIKITFISIIGFMSIVCLYNGLQLVS